MTIFIAVWSFISFISEYFRFMYRDKNMNQTACSRESNDRNNYYGIQLISRRVECKIYLATWYWNWKSICRVYSQLSSVASIAYSLLSTTYCSLSAAPWIIPEHCPVWPKLHYSKRTHIPPHLPSINEVLRPLKYL